MRTFVDLRQVMRRWPSGVAIVMCGDTSRRNGLTVNSLVSVSMNPPAISITLQNSSHTHQLISELGYFSVNFLSGSQSEISEIFAGKVAENLDRFTGIDVVTGITGAPIMLGAHAILECCVMHRYEMNESTLYVGEVVRTEQTTDQSPLVYFNRSYHRISDE